MRHQARLSPSGPDAPGGTTALARPPRAASHDALEHEADQAAGLALQRAPASAGSDAAPTGRDRRLEPADLHAFERGFGHRFADVRIHADAAADRDAARLGARAYTCGHEIRFRAGAYRPGDAEGRRLLAHELAHVVQQNQRPPGAAPWIQRQPETKTLKKSGIDSSDPTSSKSLATIQDVLGRNKALAPYIGGSLKRGLDIAQKGHFVIEITDANFESAYHAVYGEDPTSDTLGFFDNAKSIVHLRPKTTLGTALHEAVHSLASPALYRIAARAQHIAGDLNHDLARLLIEGITAFFVDRVLADEGLQPYNDAYAKPKQQVADLAAALGKDKGMDLIAKLDFQGNLLAIGEALGVTAREFTQLAVKHNSAEIDRVLHAIDARL